MELTNEQWQRIARFIPKPKAQPGKSGRPPQNTRDVLNGILWILRTGAQWADLPERYPPKSTCHRYFQQWNKSGVFVRILTALAQDLKKRGGIDLSEGFIDGSFAPAKKGAMVLGKTKRGEGTKIMGLTDAFGLPIAVDATSASPCEIKLVDDTLDACFLENVPQKVIGDKTYDSDPLDKRLAEERGVELIAPHKNNRIKSITQDGRVLRRYRKRWKVERLFAWLQNFRRLVVRYEYHLKNFLAMIQLGCIVILLRRVLG
ncbi:MAG: IS5 family transposase [Sedimentisphaerales bacterium]